MDELCEDFGRMAKISALNKLSKINQNHLCREVTIGPNAFQNPSRAKTRSHKTYIKKPDPKNDQNVKGNQDKSHLYDICRPQSEYALIKEIHNLKRQEERDKALNRRVEAFQQFSKQQEVKRQNLWLRTQQAFIDDIEKQEMHIAQANQRLDLHNSTQQAKLVQQYQDAAVRMRKRQEEVRAKEKERQVLRESIEKVKRNQSHFTSEYEQIFGILRSCKDNVELRDLLGQDTELLKTLPSEMETLVASCKSSTISEKEVNKSSEILNKITNLKNQFRRTVEEINNRINNKSVEAPEIETPVGTPQKPVSQSTPQDSLLSTPVNASQPQSSDVPDAAQNIILEKYVSVSNLKLYTDVIEFLEKHKQSFIQLDQDPSMKQFKFDCKKAVNISVNALSGANAEHILDKYRKLHRLLAGQSIIVSDKEVNASRYPQGVAFCMDLLAKKLVLQGDLMVSNKPEYAFCYASLIVTLWNDFPVFGTLVLGYFYKSCPYLVPYYMFKQVDETDEEFYKKLGYQYNTDGQIESQDKFLKRMTGIISLYAAILITKPKRGQSTHPHNLKHGWRWLASLLKLEPQIDITATALYTFLEMVGFEMDAKYSLGFKKLIKIIMTVFLEKCKKVKSIDGPITRLELQLKEYFKSQKFETPEGYVDYAYW